MTLFKRVLPIIAIASAAFLLTQVLIDEPSARQTKKASDKDRESPVASMRAPDHEGLRSYAVSMDELQGLSPDAPRGTRLELWVTYEPPVTRRVRHFLVVKGAVLEKIAPAVTPTGPDAALLLVPQQDIRKLLTADRLGSLSATARP
jgi:hypothetical protein